LSFKADMPAMGSSGFSDGSIPASGLIPSSGSIPCMKPSVVISPMFANSRDGDEIPSTDFAAPSHSLASAVMACSGIEAKALMPSTMPCTIAFPIATAFSQRLMPCALKMAPRFAKKSLTLKNHVADRRDQPIPNTAPKAEGRRHDADRSDNESAEDGGKTDTQRDDLTEPDRPCRLTERDHATRSVAEDAVAEAGLAAAEIPAIRELILLAIVPRPATRAFSELRLRPIFMGTGQLVDHLDHQINLVHRRAPK
jgi:hypothetical protein